MGKKDKVKKGSDSSKKKNKHKSAGKRQYNGSALQWINLKAKELRKKHPKMAWKDLVKKASVKYREQKKSKK